MPVGRMAANGMEWATIKISQAAQRTINPIRKVVDKLQVPPNPDKALISLGLGIVIDDIKLLDVLR